MRLNILSSIFTHLNFGEYQRHADHNMRDCSRSSARDGQVNSVDQYRRVVSDHSATRSSFRTLREDAIKTITGTRVPFTQILRIRATIIPAGTPLAGKQIESLLRFNLFGGTTTFVGESFVDVSIRGHGARRLDGCGWRNSWA